VHPLHSPPPYPHPQAGEGRVGVLGRAQNARQPKARTPWQDCRTLLTESNLGGPYPPPRRVKVGKGPFEDDARSVPLSCSWHSWRKP